MAVPDMESDFRRTVRGHRRFHFKYLLFTKVNYYLLTLKHSHNVDCPRGQLVPVLLQEHCLAVGGVSKSVKTAME